LRYTLNAQPGEAPLVMIIPGTGAGPTARLVDVLARIFYAGGYGFFFIPQAVPIHVVQGFAVGKDVFIDNGKGRTARMVGAAQQLQQRRTQRGFAGTHGRKKSQHFAVACLLQVYFRETEGQQPDPDWMAQLQQLSDKFRSLGERARSWATGRAVT